MTDTYQSDKPIIAVHGTVGKDPAKKGGSNARGEWALVEFSLAVTTSYEKDAQAMWFQVAVWNEGLMESVLAEVYKGAKVAIEGTYTAEEGSNGVLYHKCNASRVFLMEPLARSERARATEVAPSFIPGMPPSSVTAAPSTAVASAMLDADLDDLPF